MLKKRFKSGTYVQLSHGIIATFYRNDVLMCGLFLGGSALKNQILLGKVAMLLTVEECLRMSLDDLLEDVPPEPTPGQKLYEKVCKIDDRVCATYKTSSDMLPWDKCGMIIQAAYEEAAKDLGVK